jgi:hypothetical protein
MRISPISFNGTHSKILYTVASTFAQWHRVINVLPCHRSLSMLLRHHGPGLVPQRTLRNLLRLALVFGVMFLLLGWGSINHSQFL